MTIERWMVALALISAACGEATSPTAERQEPPWFGRTRGGAVVMSRDERIAVVVSRSTGIVTVFELDPEQPLASMVTGRTELDLGADSEPWAAVIGADGDTAYVILRRDQEVVRLVGLRDAPEAAEKRLATGSEPTAIALAPSGDRLFVANWGEGTISVITTPDFAVKAKLDLNQALVATGLLGGIAPRVALAHPRALAITDDGDDSDRGEVLYATEFFSVPLSADDAGSPDDAGFFDRNRQGLVYPIPLDGGGEVGEPISISPVPDTGTADANGAVTGCFPNQLYAAAVDGEKLFVTSLCASPVGPLGPPPAPAPANPGNFKTVMHPALFVIDTKERRELPELRQVLTQELDARYAADEATEARMPLIPNDLAFGPAAGEATDGPRVGCVTAMGADALFCGSYDADGRLRDIGRPGRRFIETDPRGQRAARLPVGVAISQQRGFALVAAEYTQTLSIVDLEAGAVVERQEPIQHARGSIVRNSREAEGRRLFATGLGVWSFHGEARVSCEGCHPDGLSDGVTWFFARGPRRTLSTAGTYDDEGRRRVLLWTANVDEIHDVEGIVRSVAGGVGAITWEYPGNAPTNDARIVYDGSAIPPAVGKPTTTLHQNLNASVKELLSSGDEALPCGADATSCDVSPVHEWDAIDAYIQSVRAPMHSPDLDTAAVARGSELFVAARCTSCHGGPDWTVSRVFYTPSAVNNGALPYARPADVTDEQLGRLRLLHYAVPAELRALNPPGASGSAPYRRWDPPSDRSRVVHLYGNEADDGYDSKKTHGGDQINCVLRAVGTFPDQSAGENASGIVPEGSPIVVREVRDNMTVLALGATGFNVPSLVGMAVGAPYFHAGNARTLEEAFDPAFAPHHDALTTAFAADDSERADQVRDLVAFLLSIDDDKRPADAVPADDLCALGPAVE